MSASMEADKVWWRQVGRSLRLLEEIARYLAAAESFLLYAPGGIPWEHTLQQCLKEVSSGTDAERMLRICADTGVSPDRYCLQELCPRNLAEQWWPSIPPARYLCQNGSIPFHKMFIYVTGISRVERLLEWILFENDYAQAAMEAGLTYRAVFILETTVLPPAPLRMRDMEETGWKAEKKKGGKKKTGREASQDADATQVQSPLPPCLSYRITENDCRVFCMEILSGGEMAQATDYLVELAVQVGGNRPEICQALLENPDALFTLPVASASRVLKAQGVKIREEELYSLIWKAQIRQFFPLLEEYRMAFLREAGEALYDFLPLQNDFGKLVTDSMDLEFRDIQKILRARGGFPGISEKQVNDCRQARNRLAHNDLLSSEDVTRLLQMK